MTKRTRERLERIIDTEGIGTLLGEIEEICYQKSLRHGDENALEAWKSSSVILGHTIVALRLVMKYGKIVK